MGVTGVADVASIILAVFSVIVAITAWVSAKRRADEVAHRHLAEVTSLKEKVAAYEEQARWLPSIQGDIREIKADLKWLKECRTKGGKGV